MSAYLKQGLHGVLVGEVESGKSHQYVTAYNLRFVMPDGSDFYPFRPAVVIVTGSDRSSAAGTAGDMVTADDCRFVKVADVDSARHLMRREVPLGINGQPFRMVVLDSWSSFRDQAAAEARHRLVTEGERGKSVAGQIQKNPAYNSKEIHRQAQPDVVGLFQEFLEVSAASPRLMISTCHTRGKYTTEGTRIGEEPVLYDSMVTPFRASANFVWHMRKVLPRTTGMSAETINQRHEQGLLKPSFVAYTTAMHYPEIGELSHCKCQRSGSMAAFANLPPVWTDPNLGFVLAYTVARQHGFDITPCDEHGNPTDQTPDHYRVNN